MNRYIPEKIGCLEEYTPDNGTYRLRADANESPYLPSEAVMEEFRAELARLDYNRYPDSNAAQLLAAFSELYGLDSDCIVAGNGSDELISLLSSTFLSPGDRAMVLLPDFSMYEFYAKISGAEVVRYDKHTDFTIDFSDVTRRVREENIRLVIFSNPCNPTGYAIDRGTVERFLDETDALIVVDEAYMEFCREDCSVLSQCSARENLIVLKTLSKAFGLAALRCGFAVGNTELIGALRKVKSPYNVNMLTQRLATAALRHAGEIRVKTDRIITQRARMQKALQEMAGRCGIRVYESDTNFVLIDAGPRAGKIYESLRAHSLNIRLMTPYLRLSALDDEGTTLLLAELERACTR